MAKKLGSVLEKLIKQCHDMVDAFRNSSGRNPDPEEIARRVLAAAPDADRDFQMVLERATREYLDELETPALKKK